MTGSKNKIIEKLKQALLIGVLSVFTITFAVSCLNGPTEGAFLSVNREQCTGCGECKSVCATTAIQILDNKAVIDPSECIECGKCVEVCNWNAIQ